MFHISEVHAGYRNRAKWTLLLQNSSGRGFGNRTRRLRGGPALRTAGVGVDLLIYRWVTGFVSQDSNSNPELRVARGHSTLDWDTRRWVVRNITDNWLSAIAE